MNRGSKRIGSGTRLQSGIRLKDKFGTDRPNGLQLKGAVMASYVTDDINHPLFTDLQNRPSAVYCDVVVYSSIGGQHWFPLKKVLVSQKYGGIQNGDTWIPKATSMNVVTGVLNTGPGANIAQFDGDHVLISFINNSFDEPVIIRGLPHPSRDIGNEIYSVGKRMKLIQVDGIPSAPDFDKYNGVFRGVDSLGNHVVDSTFGHNGQLIAGGAEPPADVTGFSGNQSRSLPQNATHEVTFYNMSNPVLPVEVAKFKCTKSEFEILITLLPTLKVEGSAATAKLTLGTGTVSAAIAETLATLWASLVSWLALHTHPDPATGFTGVPVQAATIPPWDAAIVSGRLTFPAG